jgi:hypothetical protein
MKFFIVLLAAMMALATASVVRDEQHRQPHERKEHDSLLRDEKKHENVEHDKKDVKKDDEKKEEKEEDKFDIRDLVAEKKEHLFFKKEIEYFLNNPVTKMDRECFAKLKPGQSIDFVIDIAWSPINDKVDKSLADSPVALFLERTYRSASRAYFGAIQFFIDAVTLDVKPEATHSIIVESGHKFYLRGRRVDDVESLKKLKSGGEFTDERRNLKTLWPEPTKEVVSNLFPIVKNNLGRMTKLTLWNRDNGVPTVLFSSRRSKPVYTVLITDGASGDKIDDLIDDVEDWRRVTVIDIGNRRFAKKLSWDEIKKFAGVYTLTAPQQLPLMLDTVRNMACECVKNVEE